MSEPRDLSERRRLLAIYLNDHLMGATGGVELARRCLRSNAGTALAPPLEELVEEIAEDRATLVRLMAGLQITPSRAKVALAGVGEKLARLKLNGRLLGYSPLSRLVELEALCGAAQVKARLWLTLRRLSEPEATLAGVDLDRLVERAASQTERFERLRLDAVERALPRPAGRGGGP